MSQVTKETKQYFCASLQQGEQRKILYLYDKEKDYWNELEDFAKETDLFQLVEVNEFNYIHTNYLIEKELPDKNLFLYFSMKQPQDEENPLLDIILYSKELKMDRKSQLFSELGIHVESNELVDLIEKYELFFKAKERRNRFLRLFSKSLNKNTDDFEMSIYASLAKVNQPDWIEVFILLLEEVRKDKQPIWESIQKFGNLNGFWKMVYQLFRYEKDEGSLDPVQDLLNSLFVTHFADELKEPIPKELHRYILQDNNRVLVFINQWMNRISQRDSYEKMAIFVEEKLAISEEFKNYPLKDFSKVETFHWVDEYIVQNIAQELIGKKPDLDFYESMILKRRDTFWYQDFRNDYHLLKWGICILRNILQIELTDLHTAQDMWNKYEEEIWKIDQAYRKFYFYYDQLNEHKEVFRKLQEVIEHTYLTQFLSVFSEKWSASFEGKEPLENIALSDFYAKYPEHFVKQDKKVFVIISDGLRFEAGNELLERLTGSNRFSGDIAAIQTMLPSNTALGMAALLPHKKLEIQENGDIFVDGMKSNSTENRNAILKNNIGESGIAIQYEDIIQKNRDELRAVFAGKKLIYIYHNRIDVIGDQKKMENSVFQAVEDSLQQLQRLLTRLATELSASQVFVTADHGFLYQRSPIKTAQKVAMDQKSLGSIRNKRFVIGGEELEKIEGITQTIGEYSLHKNITVPRGINRFTFAGGGYQYVHGGHLPQEIMVPLLSLKSIRGEKGTHQVDLTLLNQNRVITNDLIWLNFLQTTAVSDYLKEKRLSIYFEDKNGIPISNEVSLIAGSRDQLNENRIYEKKFVILNRKFESFENCHLVMRNIEDNKDVKKEVFEIDIVE